MTVMNKLASSLNRRDEAPNIALAEAIVSRNEKKAVRELLQNLKSDDKKIQSDCIKVLYEVGARNPNLIAAHVDQFLRLLEGTNNRLIWGAMTALDALTTTEPKAITGSLRKILKASDSGSVITRDHAISILTKLALMKQYADRAFPLLIKQLKACPTNQLPMYAENALPVVTGKRKAPFISVLESRLHMIQSAPKRRRVEKVLEKLKK